MKHMKTACSIVLISILLILVFSISASANSWGLRGDLLDKVSAVNTWNDYSTICKQAGDAAVMGSRYHNALMLVEDGELKVYTTAVHQPGSPRDDVVGIEKNGDALILAYGKYGKGERYVFKNCEYGYCLTDVMVGEFRMELVNEDGWQRFKAYDAYDESYLSWVPYLSQFNIELFPRSVDEVKHLNYMLAVLESGSQVLPEDGLYRSNVGKGTAPVYSAPFGNAAWRAGKGKASVGLKGDFWTLKTFAGSDGEAYTLIKYDVSERTQRFGYVRSKDIKEEYDFEIQDDLINVDLVARRDTYLTDDPDVSQYPQFKVPEGTQFKCMATYDDEYAYVSAEVKDGKFVDGGQIVWGFVPLADLDVDPAGNYYGEVQPDAMIRLEGEWQFYAGGNQAQDKLIFYPDGTYQGVYAKGDDLGDEVDTGMYTVRAHNPDCNLYWNDPPYELTLMDEDGTVNIKGLSFGEQDGEETFSLTFWEGGGGYVRIKESEDGGNG